MFAAPFLYLEFNAERDNLNNETFVAGLFRLSIIYMDSFYLCFRQRSNDAKLGPICGIFFNFTDYVSKYCQCHSEPCTIFSDQILLSMFGHP